jgi:hypothetical protein
MSFSPLPDILKSDLARLRGAVVLELGAADGRFTRALREVGADVVPLDRSRPVASGGVVADARALPVRPGAVRLIVAANLLQHLGRRRGVGGVGRLPGRRLPAPAGRPLADTPARRNDQELRDWLSRLVASRERLPRALSARCPGQAAPTAGFRPRAQPHAPGRERALALLRGDGGAPTAPPPWRRHRP